jgi:hypothetical protein
MHFGGSENGVFLGFREIRNFKYIRAQILILHLLQQQYFKNLADQHHHRSGNTRKTTKHDGNIPFDLLTETECLKFGFSEAHLLKAVKQLEKQKLILCMWKEKNSLTGLMIVTTREVGHD